MRKFYIKILVETITQYLTNEKNVWQSSNSNQSQPYISRCLGSGQHLKNKFGSGYLLEIKLKSSCAAEEDLVAVDRLDKFVNDQFPDASQIEKFGERMIYKIPQSNITSLSATFTALEEGRDRRVGYCEMCWISYDMNS